MTILPLNDKYLLITKQYVEIQHFFTHLSSRFIFYSGLTELLEWFVLHIFLFLFSPFLLQIGAASSVQFLVQNHKQYYKKQIKVCLLN